MPGLRYVGLDGSVGETMLTVPPVRATMTRGVVVAVHGRRLVGLDDGLPDFDVGVIELGKALGLEVLFADL